MHTILPQTSCTDETALMNTFFKFQMPFALESLMEFFEKRSYKRCNKIHY